MIIFSIIFFISHFISFTPLSELPRKIKNKIYRLLGYTNDYNSFAYKKSSNYCQYFVDAKDYFEDLFKNLMNAKESIFITDFWLSPELFLKRPVDENIYIDMAKKKVLKKDFGKNISRIMDILDYKAKQGLKIYILIFYEWGPSLTINSKHTENIFKQLNTNINILRFPKNQKVLLWTNHEKIVVIDKIIGYVGGFDLCWGRYDNRKHVLTEKKNKDNIYEFPFLDYSNERLKGFSNINSYTKPIISRENTQRLPWHDINCRIIGPSVEDITKHFIERWNYAIMSELKENGIIPNIKNLVSFKNEYSKIIKNFFSKTDDEIKTFLEIDDNINKKLEEDVYKQLKKEGVVSSDVQVLRSASSWNIDIDSKNTENSILKAYYDLIENAEHYIFIENQFFISKSWTNKEKSLNSNSVKDIVKNEISLYIRKRIEKAYEKKENFRVYIILPLLPDFTGEIDEKLTLQQILKHTYRTICRNEGLSLIEQLEKKMGDKWKEYISFYSLRNHGIINGAPKTELIYIHSKLLIVDDRKVIIGSANLNDRSMLGNRDSEIAVLIEEQKEDYFLMNRDNEYSAAKFAVGLRKKLMSEYLGIDIDDSILDDPVSDKLFKFMSDRAKKNTKIYRSVFGCYPDDEYTSFQLIENARKAKKEELPEEFFNKYMDYKDKIVGFIVEYPLKFLKNENLGAISRFSLEEFLPENAFT